MNPKVSVIIPTKERPLYLAQAVKSVLSQTYPVYEILIVNDGSNENLFSQIDEIKLLSSRIVIYHLPENRGPSFARNFALDNAKGDFIIFLDDDDLIHPKMIESSLSLFGDEIDIVSSFYAYIFSMNEIFEQKINLSEENPGDGIGKYVKPVHHIHCKGLEQRPFYELLRYPFPIHSSLIRKCSLDRVKFPEDLKLAEDTYFWLTLAFRGCHFKCNKEFHAFYRLHNTNQIQYRKDFHRSFLKYLYKLSSSGMLQENEDLFYIYSLIFFTLLRQRSPKSLRYLINMMKLPRYLPKYINLYLYRKLSKQYYP